MLSSLVLNPPYKIDGFTTSPKISKILNLPYGLRIDSSLLIKVFCQGVLSMALFMAVSSMLIFCFYLPIQKQNNELLKTVKSLTNEKYILLANLQEASSYTKLFPRAEMYSLKDTKEIIHVQNSANNLAKDTTLIALNKYPSIQFSGF